MENISEKNLIYKENKDAIRVWNLTKKFGDLTAVENSTFTIERGIIVGILGPNGAGKTTTIRMITGVFKLENNSKIEVFGEDISKSKNKYKKNFGIIPEVSNAFSDYTVWQNMKFSGGIYGLSREIIKKRAIELLTKFNLIDKIHSKTKSLSKGLKQRLNLCIALLHDPPILIMDEPTSGLDPISVNLMREQILKLKAEGKTILITTHNMREAQIICDRILIMNKGKIIASESPDYLRKKFKSPSTIRCKVDICPPQQKEQLLNMFKFSEEGNHLLISSKNAIKDISILYQLSKENNLKISELKIEDTSLEQVFIHLIEEDSNNKEEVEKK